MADSVQWLSQSSSVQVEFYYSIETELTRAVDVIRVNKLIFFFASRYFVKEIKNMFSRFLLSFI